MLRAPRPSRGNQGLMSTNQRAKPTMLTLLWLLVLSHGISNSRCSTVPDNSTDMLSLLDFKQAINYPAGVLSSWNPNKPHCQWEGVNCRLKHPGRVTGLSLVRLGLSGPIAPSIGNLTFLESLVLTANSFSGELPPLNRLHRLQELRLEQNSLQGVIPPTITNCSNLFYLDLSSNSLVGEIPLNIGLLSELIWLQLNNNKLSGTIPTSLKNNTILEALNLADNQLTGSIPDELGTLLHLQGLSLGRNILSGGISEILFNRSSLQSLDLTGNMLGNALPSDIGYRLPNIQYLMLGNNTFEGPIPASLGNISGLQQLDLSYNKFSGQIPSSLGNPGMLSSLNFQVNKLEAKDSHCWDFLSSLVNRSALEELILGENNLQGAIPNSIGDLSETFKHLGLDSNDFSGTVPASIGNLTGLTRFDLSNNNLNGSIEGWVGKLDKLEALYLHRNNFIGQIPSSIGNLTNLALLSLAENGFEGVIPSSMSSLNKLTLLSLEKNKFQGPIPNNLGSLPMLTQLNLSYNDLQGGIPKELFSAQSALIKLVLSYNNLEGHLPPEISNLQQLTELYVSSNKLSGEIPTTLGNCKDLQVIEMGHNFLEGDISPTLSGLTSLTFLNLSYNNLSGSIPIELGDLNHLTQLDLSYNNLQGKVPEIGVFANASFVSLRGNWGLCGGRRELHMRPCPVPRRKEIQYYLIRVLIPVFGFMSLLFLVYFMFTESKMSRPKNLPFPFGEQLLKVSYNDLAQATRNFSVDNLVGRGSYGSVYKGKLTKGKLEVAVKVLDLDMHGAEKSFLAECEALRNIQHRNLVPIITACSTVDNEGKLFKALVYEFMPNGNLDMWLHHKGDGKDPKRLGLTQRMNIIGNIADALDYLHNDTGSRPIIHCDVKPSNILLDDDMNARLGDFGIASFYHGSSSTPTGDSITSSFGVKGTIGYIAPEYARGGRASTCGDAHSFGIVLLEMLTSKRPTDPMFEKGLNIVNFVEGNFQDQMLHVIDNVLQEECKTSTQSNSISEREVCQCLCSLLEVALSCTCQYPSQRMNMRQAAAKVREIQASYMRGNPKTFYQSDLNMPWANATCNTDKV